MKFTDAVCLNGPQMFFGAVSFMFGKIVLGIFLMVFFHHAVPCYLGNDGGGGNGVA